MKYRENWKAQGCNGCPMWQGRHSKHLPGTVVAMVGALPNGHNRWETRGLEVNIVV